MSPENFTTFTDAEIVAHLATLDLGEPFPSNYLADMPEWIRTGKAVIERREYGYAIVFPGAFRKKPAGAPGLVMKTIIEVIYISEDQRGTETGPTFLSELKGKYARFPIEAVCFEERARAFFAKGGFALLRKDGGVAFVMEFTQPTSEARPAFE